MRFSLLYEIALPIKQTRCAEEMGFDAEHISPKFRAEAKAVAA